MLLSSPAYFKAGSTADSEFVEVWFAPPGSDQLHREPQCVEATRFDDGSGWIMRLVMADGQFVAQDWGGKAKRETLRGRVEIRRCA